MAPYVTTSDVVNARDLPRKLTLYNYKCVAFAAVGSIIIGYCLSAVATTLVLVPVLQSIINLSLTFSGSTSFL